MPQPSPRAYSCAVFSAIERRRICSTVQKTVGQPVGRHLLEAVAALPVLRRYAYGFRPLRFLTEAAHRLDKADFQERLVAQFITEVGHNLVPNNMIAAPKEPGCLCVLLCELEELVETNWTTGIETRCRAYREWLAFGSDATPSAGIAIVVSQCARLRHDRHRHRAIGDSMTARLWGTDVFVPAAL